MSTRHKLRCALVTQVSRCKLSSRLFWEDACLVIDGRSSRVTQLNLVCKMLPLIAANSF